MVECPYVIGNCLKAVRSWIKTTLYRFHRLFRSVKISAFVTLRSVSRSCRRRLIRVVCSCGRIFALRRMITRKAMAVERPEYNKEVSSEVCPNYRLLLLIALFKIQIKCINGTSADPVLPFQ